MPDFVSVVTIVTALMLGQAGPTPLELVEEYERCGLARGIELARKVAALPYPALFQRLERKLEEPDRRKRADAALVFALRGERRGFAVLKGILEDRSDRPRNHGTVHGRWTLAGQVRSDRYYAVHVLAHVTDPLSTDIVLPLLLDGEVNQKAAWALGEIGDRRAIPALIERLDDPDALVRTSAIRALARLEAAEALPHLRALLADRTLPRAGDRIAVGEAARAAITEIERALRQKR